MKIIYLKISTFRGISMGASHYYAHLIVTEGNNYNKTQLSYQMSQSDADNLNKKEEHPWYRAGETSTRFDTKDLIREAAISYCSELYNDDEYMLVEGDPVYMYDKKYNKILAGLRPVWFDTATNREIDNWLRESQYN